MGKRKIFSTSEVKEILETKGYPRSARTIQQYHERDGIGEKIAGRLFFDEKDIKHMISRQGKVGKPKKSIKNKINT